MKGTLFHLWNSISVPEF